MTTRKHLSYYQKKMRPGEETEDPTPELVKNATCHDMLVTGSALARMVGYDETQLSSLPDGLVAGFRGTGNPFLMGELNRNSTVVDIGCGEGLDAVLASRMVGGLGKVYGIEVTKQTLARARAWADTLHLRNLTFLHAKAEQLPLPDGLADHVISNGTISMFTSMRQTFEEVYRILRQGGTAHIADALIMLPADVTFNRILLAWKDREAWENAASEYASILQSAGFHDIRIEHFHPVLQWAQPTLETGKVAIVGAHILATK